MLWFAICFIIVATLGAWLGWYLGQLEDGEN